MKPSAGVLGFAVPLRLASSYGELCLMTTVTSFATAVDVTLAELKLEAFLLADPAIAEALSRAAGASSHPPARRRVREQHAAGEAGDLLGGR